MNRRAYLRHAGALAVGAASATAGCRGLAAPAADPSRWPAPQFDAGRTGHPPGGSGPTNPVDPDWTATVPARTRPIVGPDRVFVLGPERVHAVDRERGETDWRADYRTPGEGGCGPTAPVLGDERLYVLGCDGLRAFDREDGSREWTHDQRYERFDSPVLDDGRLYVADRRRNALEVFDPATDDRLELYESEDPPLSVVPGDDLLFTTHLDGWGGSVLARNPASGAERWSVDLQHVPTRGPTLANGTLYVPATVYDHPQGYLYALDAETGDEQWRFSNGDDDRSPHRSPAVANGTVYVGTDRGLVALDADDGRVRWRFETENWVRTEPAVVDGVVYFGQDATTYAVDAATGDELWRFAGTADRSFGAPAVVDGTAFVRGDERVVALSE